MTRKCLLMPSEFALTEKQVRNLLSKLEEYDFVKRSGSGRNTQYAKTEHFPKIGVKN